MAVGRLVVLGGGGAFGQVVVAELQRLGFSPIVAGRRDAALLIDANDLGCLRATLDAGDLVIDGAGPFQERSLALLEAACEMGFDVIDLNDHLDYAEQVIALEPRIAEAGIRVLSSASSVSAMAALVIQKSRVERPVRVTGFIVPVTKGYTKSGSARSLLRSVGSPVRVLRRKEWVTCAGWTESRRFPMPEPIGAIRGHLFESADSVWLPRIWPSLETVEMFIDTNVWGLNTLLRLAARLPPVRRVIERSLTIGSTVSNILGAETGGLGYEIANGQGGRLRYAIVGPGSHRVPAAPAVLAARALLDGELRHRGLVPPHRQTSPAELESYLQSLEVQIVPV